LPCTSGQETERVYSYNPGACTGHFMHNGKDQTFTDKHRATRNCLSHAQAHNQRSSSRCRKLSRGCLTHVPANNNIDINNNSNTTVRRTKRSTTSGLSTPPWGAFIPPQRPGHPLVNLLHTPLLAGCIIHLKLLTSDVTF